MRALVCLLVVGCGGGASVSGDPAAGIASLACDRLGPDGTGFMIDGAYAATLDPGQVFAVAFRFPTTNPPINESNIYSCGAWTNLGFGDAADGCQREVGQSEASLTVSHSLAIEFPAPVPSPATVTVTARVVPSPGSTTVVAEDADTVDCN